MKEFVTFLARRLVDKPDEVDVQVREEDTTIIVELRVAREDLGKVIGKQGRTARAMREVMSARASREQKSSRLEILE